MLSRLSGSDYPELHALAARTSDDPAIALLDAWATVGDVLAFYQERIANEGFLRTATERRSIVEAARLVGYELRPGIAASVFLAYTVDKDLNGKHTYLTIPKGSRAQSVPGPDELPQSFETGDDLAASSAWNDLKPRAWRPMRLFAADAAELDVLYLAGVTTNLKPGDRLLLVFAGAGGPVPVLLRVKTVEPEQIVPDPPGPPLSRTVVRLQQPEEGFAELRAILSSEGGVRDLTQAGVDQSALAQETDEDVLAPFDAKVSDDAQPVVDVAAAGVNALLMLADPTCLRGEGGPSCRRRVADRGDRPPPVAG